MFTNKNVQFWGMLLLMFIIICISAYLLFNNQIKRMGRIGGFNHDHEDNYDPLI